MTNYERLRARVLLRRIHREVHASVTSWRWWVSLSPYVFWGGLVFLAGFTFGAQWLADFLVTRLSCVAR